MVNVTVSGCFFSIQWLKNFELKISVIVYYWAEWWKEDNYSLASSSLWKYSYVKFTVLIILPKQIIIITADWKNIFIKPMVYVKKCNVTWEQNFIIPTINSQLPAQEPRIANSAVIT